ncbi:hypothetical protein F511_07944 [Dorcoceras hygrometricum]|uniref:Uncharacterized protein n=1 Tax=Dorcoceras hygrometricum TaxID=472368 RepID=A0A2Z7C9B6_9LAMI|nr:hypothetical protein F511_07944 [Dorcoceras hygrometricum]
MAEEKKSAWAYSDSEESSSGTSSSSESEDEVQCLMANDTEEVFDFSNLEFTREDLINALNEMISSSNMQVVLSKLETENAELRSRSEEILYENQRLVDIISSWTKSSASLQKLQGAIKPSGDKT